MDFTRIDNWTDRFCVGRWLRDSDTVRCDNGILAGQILMVTKYFIFLIRRHRLRATSCTHNRKVPKDDHFAETVSLDSCKKGWN